MRPETTSTVASTPSSAASSDTPAPAQPAAPTGFTSSTSTDTPSTTPSEPQTAVIGGNDGRTSFQVTDKGWKPENSNGGRKKWLLIGGAAVVVLGAVAGVFGWYIPSRPENVWNTGLSRTGKVVDRIMQDVTDPKALETRTAYDLDGDMSIKSSAISGSGKLNLKADEKNSDSGFMVDLKSTEGDKLSFGVDAKTLNPKDSLYPDTYMRLHGLSTLPVDLNQMLPGITNYDNKWIFIPSASLARIMSQSSTDTAGKDTQVTAQDVSEAARVASKTTREYVFTDAKDKAVIERKSFVGKETVDGVKTYHYTAAINKQHAKDYCLALVDGVSATKLYEKLVDKADRSKTTAEAKKSCEDYAKNGKAAEDFDLWIGGKYNLIHKIRISDETNKKSYVDFGQTYTGGDELPFFMAVHEEDSKTDVRVDMKINSKTYNFNSSFSMQTGSGEEKVDFSGHINGTATDKKVSVTAPTDAVKLDDVLKALALPPLEQLVPTPTESI
jgi:hypothetical protein